MTERVDGPVRDGVPVPDGNAVGVRVDEGGCVAVALSVLLQLGVAVDVSDRVPLVDGVATAVAVGVDDVVLGGVDALDDVGDAVRVVDAVIMALGVGVSVRLLVDVDEADAVPVRVAVRVAVADWVALADCVVDPESVNVADGDRELVGVLVAVFESEAVALGVRVAVGVVETEADGDADDVDDVEIVRLRVGVRDEVTDADDVRVPVVGDADGVGVPVWDIDGVFDGEPVCVAVAVVGDAVGVDVNDTGVIVADGVVVAVSTHGAAGGTDGAVSSWNAASSKPLPLFTCALARPLQLMVTETSSPLYTTSGAGSRIDIHGPPTCTPSASVKNGAFRIAAADGEPVTVRAHSAAPDGVLATMSTARSTPAAPTPAAPLDDAPAAMATVAGGEPSDVV